MTLFIIKIDDFGDIIEFAKWFVQKKTDWKTTLADAEKISITEEDVKLCMDEKTPSKPEKVQ